MERKAYREYRYVFTFNVQSNTNLTLEKRSLIEHQLSSLLLSELSYDCLIDSKTTKRKMKTHTYFDKLSIARGDKAYEIFKHVDDQYNVLVFSLNGELLKKFVFSTYEKAMKKFQDLVQS